MRSITSIHGTNGSWLGSGVAVGDGTHVIGAYHSVDETDGDLTVRVLGCDADGEVRLKESFDAKVVATNATHDVALLKINGWIQPLSRANGVTYPGSTVRLFGVKTLGESGVVSDRNEVIGPVQKGDSGGAVVNEYGELIGIATKAFFTPDQPPESGFTGYRYVPISIVISALT